MARKDYKVTSVFLKSVEFEVLILKIPEGEIEDKLAYLARDKGQITKSSYEDFAIATCVANVNQLLFHLNQNINIADNAKLLKIRDELIDIIVSENKTLNPKKLYINRNYVIKIRRRGKKLAEDEKLLVDNKNWNTSYYEDMPDVYGSELIEELDSGKKEEEEIPEKNAKNTKPLGPPKDVDSLEFTTKQKWWNRIRQYVVIKVYSENDTEHILRQRLFHNRISFTTFIVSICVDKFEDLFSMLDDLEIPKRVAPPILMHELYELCRACNPSLTFDNAQNYRDDIDKDKPNNVSGRSVPNRKASTPDHSMSEYVKSKQNEKKFKDVPKEDLLKLGDRIKEELIGQNEAVDTLVESIQRASVGLKTPEKPIGSFLFAGRTGVGKTLATKILADKLIKGKDNVVTLDCSEYSADHEYSKLIGSPSGYVGHEQGGILTNAVKKNPFSIVVFDEVEKASHKVHELMLQVLEEGRLTDGKGTIVPFNDTIVIMTSNIGVKEVQSIGKTVGFGDVAVITDKKKDIALDEALKKKFKPEFLNRIDAIVNFRTLVKKDYIKIIGLELDKLNKNLKTNDTDYKNVVLTFDKRIKNFIYKKGVNEEYGARPLKRCIEQKIATPLALYLLNDDDLKDVIVNVSVNRNKVTFKVGEKVEETPFYLEESAASNKEIANGKGE